MRRFARTTVMASTAVFAAAVGAVALAPVASAQEEEAPAPAPFGSSMPESPDLAVAIGTKCVPVEGKEGLFAALTIDVENVGKGDAANVATNFAVFPDAPGVFNEEVIEAGEKVTYTVPSELTEWVSRPGGAAAFSPQLDAAYPNNIAVGLLSINCAPEVDDEADA
ncbi:Pro-kumamolisin, activation domain family protein [Rhodococcus sp. BP-252]|uniref:Pro-kumamolisin, activation domain family protein n=1 Tax=Rhodococcoides kyotonense TaxID=398843 RepID=A0A177YGM7_9NOCA|nr:MULTISPECIES: hypothetical protein [Rhodococcus]MBY6412201.1 Pro-kumamolisin, activation domain family protein [Rhodococcus sp. BP-320]MBY6416781.1 Pro-kumamolisin, activation domain family protein [Rhodococcus sp. BP-321]MBY6421681.1 Pro-kumamolisin, activation domain family protein [Rhodococcus sp. BP-324]MBY6426947.1 Pro-kumamolisin, activation domain family protein [Rhodococcus sp. BP-323]MBY6432113.1 Pro-kumamolisin, activation domain family protein [Rhodococcus sp. BP-322]